MADHNPPVLELRLLTPRAEFRVPASGESGRGRALALLAYLALERVDGVSRDELLDLLWDPEPGKDHHHRLRELLSSTRQLTPEAPLLTGEQRVRLDRSRVATDVDEFRRAFADGRYAEAAEIYEGDFMTGCCPSRARLFQEWADEFGARLRSELELALQRALDEARAAGRHDAAARYAERLWRGGDGSPDHAATYLESVLLTGDRAAAVAAAAKVERYFADVGDPPPAEVRLLLTRALAASAQAKDESTPWRTPLCVGRDVELQATRRILDRVRRRGEGAVVDIRGEAGVGKSRLLDEIEYLAQLGPVLVLRTSCIEFEARTPYATLIDLLRPLEHRPETECAARADLGLVATLLPRLTERFRDLRPPSVVETAAAATLHRAVLAVLEAIAVSTPVLLLVDDAHWCDGDSADALYRIARAADGSAILLASASRANGELSARLERVPGCVPLRPAPLASDDVRELLSSMADLADDASADGFVQHLMQMTGGVPLLLMEEIAALHEEGLVGIRDATWELSRITPVDGPLAPGRKVLDKRIAFLPVEQRAVFAALAILGRPAAAGEVAAVGGEEASQTRRHLQGLVARGVCVVDVDARFCPAHGELAAAALRGLDADAARDLSRRALATLQQPGGGLASLGHATECLRHACRAGMVLSARYCALVVVSLQDERVPAARATAALVEQWAIDPVHAESITRMLGIVERSPSSLPWRLRRAQWELRASGDARRWQLIRAAAAVTLITGLAGALALWPRSRTEPNPESLFGGGGILVIAANDGAVRALRFDGPRFDDTVAVRSPLPAVPAGAFLSPARDAYIYGCRPPGENAPAVCLRRVATGRDSVIAPSDGDNGPGGWSPDGAWVAFTSDRAVTDRYSYDVFVANLQTGVIRRISDDPFQQNWVGWSPDGSRLAYHARLPHADSLWIADFDGRVIARVEFTGRIGALSWTPDGSEIVGTVMSDDQRRLFRVNGHEVRTIGPMVEGFAHGVAWSPDRRTIALLARPRTNSADEIVFINEVVGEVGRVRLGGHGRSIEWVTHEPRPFLDSIAAVPSETRVAVGRRAAIHVLGKDQSGREYDPPFYELRVHGDPSAWIDPRHNMLFGITPGTADVIVSAGGWRADTVRIEVVPPIEPILLFREIWQNGIDTARWRSWGDPLPAVVAAPNGRRAFRNNGDAKYPSGVTTAELFSATDGLTIEWSQSTPLTGDFWQEIWIDLANIPLDRFRVGPGEPWPLSSGAVANVRSPVLEGQPPSPLLALWCNRGNNDIAYPEALRSGGWHDFAFQLHPDGSCDLIIDGVMTGYVPKPIAAVTPGNYRLVVGGRSHNTDILIGEIRVWRGLRWAIRPDSTTVDLSRLRVMPAPASNR